MLSTSCAWAVRWELRKVFRCGRPTALLSLDTSTFVLYSVSVPTFRSSSRPFSPVRMTHSFLFDSRNELLPMTARPELAFFTHSQFARRKCRRASPGLRARPSPTPSEKVAKIGPLGHAIVHLDRPRSTGAALFLIVFLPHASRAAVSQGEPPAFRAGWFDVGWPRVRGRRTRICVDRQRPEPFLLQLVPIRRGKICHVEPLPSHLS